MMLRMIWILVVCNVFIIFLNFRDVRVADAFFVSNRDIGVKKFIVL